MSIAKESIACPPISIDAVPLARTIILKRSKQRRSQMLLRKHILTRSCKSSGGYVYSQFCCFRRSVDCLFPVAQAVAGIQPRKGSYRITSTTFVITLTRVYCRVVRTFDILGARSPVEQTSLDQHCCQLSWGLDTNVLDVSRYHSSRSPLTSLTLCSIVSGIASGLAMQLTSAELQARTLTFSSGPSAVLTIPQVHTAFSLAASSTKHPHFSALAGRTFAAYLRKNVPTKSFSAWVASWANRK